MADSAVAEEDSPEAAVIHQEADIRPQAIPHQAIPLAADLPMAEAAAEPKLADIKHKGIVVRQSFFHA